MIISDTAQKICSDIECVGKYEILERNNEGMNSYAFRARHIPLDIDVFLKVYDADHRSQELFREPRFLIEATRNRDGSGNLVEVRDAELLGDEFVLVAMEYVSGGSLLKAIQNEPFGQMDAVRLAVNILHGVCQLHSQNLLHRDIKPANVLLESRCNGFWPKLGDFGSLARLQEGEVSVTASKHSALYVPPEGWEKPSRYLMTSDLYQVGLVLFEILNSPLPYDGSAYLDKFSGAEIRAFGGMKLSDLHDADRTTVENSAIYRQAKRGGIIKRGQQQPYVSPRLKKIIKKALSSDNSKRYTTATEFIGVLEGLTLPNWQSVPEMEGAYKGKEWSGFDWRIEPSPKRKEAGKYIIRRAKQGTANYRRWGKQYQSISDAAISVERI
jgi:serine/threonine protein kinase